MSDERQDDYYQSLKIATLCTVTGPDVDLQSCCGSMENVTGCFWWRTVDRFGSRFVYR